MVLLKGEVRDLIGYSPREFTFQYGSIKGKKAVRNKKRKDKFTFQYGSIKGS